MGEMAENIQGNSLVYPSDRRMWVHVKWPFLALAFVAGVAPVAAAWGWYLAFGLPEIGPGPRVMEPSASDPIGFPVWLRLAHFVNLLLQIAAVHGEGCGQRAPAAVRSRTPPRWVVWLRQTTTGGWSAPSG